MYRTYKSRRSLRLKDYDYSEPRPVHLTWGTYRRRCVLARPLLAEAIIGVVWRSAASVPMAIHAYCIMPDHAHLLVSPRDGGNVTQFVQRVKGLSTRENWGLGGRGRLWQRGYYDHVLRREEDIAFVAEYIISNPVRARLVDHPDDHPFFWMEC